MNLNDDSSKLKEDIPFFPLSLHERQGTVSIWWFERNFSQKFYGSNASRQCNSCMLIMLLIASRIRIKKIKLEAVGDQVPFNLVKSFAEAILEGNEIYCNLSNTNQLDDENLSIPDAIHAVKVCTRGLKEWFYATIHLNFQCGLKESIYAGLTEGLNRWKDSDSVRRTENHFFVILIASKQSILFVFEETTSTVTVFDSHEHHCIYGSVIAQTNIKELYSLCGCIERMYFDVYGSCPYEMELSFLECNEQNPLVYIRKFIPLVD